MAAHVRQRLTPRDSVVVVRGAMLPDNRYKVEPAPAAALAAAARQAHQAAVRARRKQSWNL